MRRLLLALLFLLPLPALAQNRRKPAADTAPKILYPVPLVVVPGQKTKLVLRGARLDAVKEVTASDPAAKVKFVAARKAGVPNNHPKEREGETEVEIELDLPKDVRPGLTLTATGPAGESTAYPLPLADATPRLAEKEGNDGFRDAQAVALPVAVSGTVRGDRDVDVFRFDGKKGQTVRVEVEAARFGSPLDPVVTLYDAGRRVLATADDSPQGADPALTVFLPADSVYYVGVIDANDLGGPNYGYRLVIRAEK